MLRKSRANTSLQNTSQRPPEKKKSGSELTVKKESNVLAHSLLGEFSV